MYDYSWKNIKNDETSISVPYIIIRNDQLNLKKKELRDKMLNEYPIPAIINPSRMYKDIHIDFSEEIKKSYSLILLKSTENNQKGIKINLSYNFLDTKTLFKILGIKYPSAIRRIGDILHINIQEKDIKIKRLIGEILIERFKQVRCIITKKLKYINGLKKTCIELIAGDRRMSTFINENDVNIFIDYSRTYYSSKLSEERTSLINEINSKGYILADCTCNNGEITLPVLKKGFIVYSNDINTHCISNIKKSLELNKDIDRSRLELFSIDASNFVQKIMLIKKAHHFLFWNPDESLWDMHPLKYYEEEYTLHVYFICDKKVDPIEYSNKYSWFRIVEDNLRFIKNVSPSKCIYKLTKSFENKKRNL